MAMLVYRRVKGDPKKQILSPTSEKHEKKTVFNMIYCNVSSRTFLPNAGSFLAPAVPDICCGSTFSWHLPSVGSSSTAFKTHSNRWCPLHLNGGIVYLRSTSRIPLIQRPSKMQLYFDPTESDRLPLSRPLSLSLLLSHCVFLFFFRVFFQEISNRTHWTDP